MAAPLVNNGILTIPIGREDLDLNLDRLFDDGIPGEDHPDFPFVLQLLAEEKPPVKFWCIIANHCWTNGHQQEAEEVCRRGIEIFHHARGAVPREDTIPMQAMLASMALAKSRGTPMEVLQDARYKVLDPQRDPPKARYYQEADRLLKGAEQIRQEASHHSQGKSASRSLDYFNQLLQLSRGIQDLFMGAQDQAMRHFDRILDRHPQHTVALLGKGCLLLRLKSYSQALKVYQQLLEITLFINSSAQHTDDAPHGKRWTGPDPRIGIGLAFWGLNRFEEARRAWKRSLALNPDSHSALTLLGLSSLHLYKSAQPLLPPGQHAQEDTLRKELYAEGTNAITRAFKVDNRTSIVASALCDHFSEKASLLIESGLFTSAADPQWATVKELLMRALKLGEHAIQYADVARAGIQAKLQFARALHMISYLPGGEIALRTLAQRYYNMVLDESSRGAKAQVAGRILLPTEALAAVGLAQIQISANNLPGASETLGKFMGKAHSSGSVALEILLLSASLKLKKQPDIALAMLERAVRMIEAASRQAAKLDETSMQEDSSSSQGIYVTSADFARSSLASEGLGYAALKSIAAAERDPFILVEMASLTQNTDPVLATRCYTAALRSIQNQTEGKEVSGSDNLLSIRCRSNAGGLLALQATEFRIQEEADLATRTSLLERAITETQAVLLATAKIPSGSAEYSATEAVRIISTYNLGRVSELTDADRAMEAYQAVLNAHPEYVDAKTRLALLHVSGSRKNKELAAQLLREAISSDVTNLDTRIVFACLLAGEMPGAPSPHWLEARDFLTDVFKGASDFGVKSFGSKQIAAEVLDKARKDAASLAALGWAYYQVLLTTRPGPNVKADRNKAMFRAMDLFDKALLADPKCAFAAQGMAVMLVEDAFAEASGDTQAPAGIASAAQDQRADERRKKSADEAIGILSKMREVREDGSVHICLGNAFMVKEEFERAVKAFELAHHRFYPEGKSSVLQNLARAEYALGLSKRMPASLETSIQHLQTALTKLESKDTPAAQIERSWVRFNQAVTRQKLLQMLLEMPPKKRSRQQISEAMEGLKGALEVFKELIPVANNRQLQHINADVLEQRIQYGENALLNQSQAMMEEQMEYEQSMEEAQKEALALREAKEAQRRQEDVARHEAERERIERLQARRLAAREKLNEVDWAVLNTYEEKKARKSGAPKSRKAKSREEEELGIIPDDSDDEGSFADKGDGSDADGDVTANRQEAFRKLKRKKGGRQSAPRKKQALSSDESSDEDGSDSDAPARKKKRAPRKKRTAVDDDDDDRISDDEEV